MNIMAISLQLGQICTVHSSLMSFFNANHACIFVSESTLTILKCYQVSYYIIRSVLKIYNF